MRHSIRIGSDVVVGAGAAVVQLEAADRDRFRPGRLHLALAQGLLASETRDQRQQPQSGPGAGTLAPLHSFGVVELLSQRSSKKKKSSAEGTQESTWLACSNSMEEKSTI